VIFGAVVLIDEVGFNRTPRIHRLHLENDSLSGQGQNRRQTAYLGDCRVEHKSFLIFHSPGVTNNTSGTYLPR